MGRKNRPRLRIEEFESRFTPAVTRSIGTLQIRDMTARYDWVSGGANISGTVVGTDALGASLDVTYTLTGPELAQATTAQGYTLDGEEVRWLNWKGAKPLISDRDYKVILKAAAGATTFSKTVVIQFPTTITNDSYKDKLNTVYHQGWLKDDDKPAQTTFRIDLTSVEAKPGNQGGRNPGVLL
jgi:hypothetical protein